jgi:formyltetrahydrofolate-dependent phosphoribosylglycinamide formyltransferase
VSGRKRVAILISGRGSNMEALLQAAAAPNFPAEIVGVLSNRPEAGGLAIATAAGIPTAVRAHQDYPDRERFDAALDAVLAGWGAELVCLAGFMRRLTPAFTGKWEGRMLNIHPSLLPAFKGLHTHRRALAAGVPEHGCTVHWVTAGLDAGPPIAQARVPVLPGDTAESLGARVLIEEHRLYPQALALVARGDATFEPTPPAAEFADDELRHFEAIGAALPSPATTGAVAHDGARLWYATFGAGPPVILLHGGLGHSGNWGHQVPALVAAGYRAVVIDSRGHGRSTRDARPYTYQSLAADVLAVMDELGIGRAALVGWSDGACAALVLADQAPERVTGVLFFACNMDPSGTKPFEMTPVVERCFNRHVKDYAALSATPDAFEAFSAAVGTMQRSEPNYTAADLARIRVPTTILLGEHDEFITRAHAEYLARTIPGAAFVLLPDVSHFAPLQRPGQFNAAMLACVERVWA